MRLADRLLAPLARWLGVGAADVSLPVDPRLDRSLQALDFVVLDTETTGLDPAVDRVVQLAGVRVSGGHVHVDDMFESLVDPERPIPPLATEVHGITDPMVRGCPKIDAVLAEFAAFAGEAVLVAHHAAFDLAFLRRAGRRCGVRLRGPVLDTMLLSAALTGVRHGHDLDEVARRHGIVVDGRHTARGDSLATARLFVHLVAQLEARGVRTLGDALRAGEDAVASGRRRRKTGTG
ncbi:MAG: 3'-5' exonuclease [Geminicoccaceae bacterium]